ncbi:glycoside hydrolase family 31 protein [Gonapodya prolifera JEL478]|uniref:Glycoside hydrolase family 31 protein n=1 Tax=Gonapodya prolifera (strain JEL478) TaxID=1344416 RepID=A0A139A1G7_GONPJ|nr:glycoside hydrolase family 31 protein [Gonapodya prolifera JEL478]|eukprot:KXS10579.1 glycoside hydrolase family 31 protein [Gonapodya prolifera JEL478]
MSTASTGYALIGPVAHSSSSIRASLRLLGPARGIHDEEDSRWRVPELIHGKRRTRTTDWAESGLSVTVNDDGLCVARASDLGDFLWRKRWQDLVFKDQYLEASSECRWGYKSVDELTGVVRGYEKASIPLDVIWTDIDYMDQLGSFYPFARNHNGLGCISQEPYLYESTSAESRKYLTLRYSLLPCYYNLLRKAHEMGTSVWNALWMCCLDDPATYSIDEQFMVGEAFMVSPVFDEGREEGKGSTVTLPAPLSEIPVHMRGGFIVALQQPGTTTESSRRGTFELVIALDSDGCAQVCVQKDGKLQSTGTYGYHGDDGRSVDLMVSKVRVFGLRHTNIVGSDSEIKVTFDIASGEQATVSSVEWDLLKGVAEVNLANAPLVSDWNIDLHLGVERGARVN